MTSANHAEMLPIAAVERDCGLSKDTLRVWERRYGFPAPVRDEFGQRAYPMEQVGRLRAIKRLLDLGYRPGRIIALSLDELHALGQRGSDRAGGKTELAAPPGELQALLELLKSHRIDELRRGFSQSILRLGLASFVSDVVAPMNVLVGNAWARGHLDIFEEHLYTESIQVVMRNAIQSVPQSATRPNVLLTTLPQESHGLGLLMAQAIFALEGARCVALGVQTPIPDIVSAAHAEPIDIVALSFSTSLNPRHVLDGLGQLRSRLDPETALWVGGACAVLHRRQIVGVMALRELTDIGTAVTAWREAHPYQQ